MIRTTMNGKPVAWLPTGSQILNDRSGFEKKLLCDGLTITLGYGCAYSCSFCYVPAVYARVPTIKSALGEAGKKHEELVMLRKGAITKLRTELVDEHGNRRFKPGDRRVVFMSPADDIAANFALLRLTADAVRLVLELSDLQIRLLSKSSLLPHLPGLIAEKASAPLDDEIRKRVIFGVSTGTFDPRVAHAIEEGTPIPEKRVESLRELQERGFRTYAMICPSLPSLDPRAYRLLTDTAAAELDYRKCEHVWAEVINLRGLSFTRTYNRLREAGLEDEAAAMQRVTTDRDAWNEYALRTYHAHRDTLAALGEPADKLRFLQYAEGAHSAYWKTEARLGGGVVLL